MDEPIKTNVNQDPEPAAQPAGGAAWKINQLHTELHGEREKVSRITGERDALKTQLEKLSGDFTQLTTTHGDLFGKVRKGEMLRELMTNIGDGFEVPDIASVESAVSVIPFDNKDEDVTKKAIESIVNIAKRAISPASARSPIRGASLAAAQPIVPSLSMSSQELLELKKADSKAYEEHLKNTYFRR